MTAFVGGWPQVAVDSGDWKPRIVSLLGPVSTEGVCGGIDTADGGSTSSGNVPGACLVSSSLCRMFILRGFQN